MLHFNYPRYPMQWYENGNPVSGNAGRFNYKVLRQGGELVAWCWMGLWCMEKTKDVKERRFAYGEAGLGEAVAWLEAEFNSRPRAEVEAKDGFLTTEPYTPAPRQAPEGEG